MKTRERLTSGKYSKIGGNMIHILICDDDTTFAHDMYKRILTLPAYSPKSMTIQCLTNANDINAELLTNCDILFLDIDLGEKNGISLARDMRRRNPEAVLIFVTNFSEYAPEGYEVDAFRYLSKTELDKKLSLYFSDALNVCRTRQRKVEISCEGESMPVPIQALAYVESQGHEQCLHLVGWRREKLYTRLTMAQLEELLFSQGFLRIHKRFLVNMIYLQTLQSTGAVLTTGHTLLYVPTKYIAFFSAIFIMLFAGVSTKYLKKFPHGIRLFIHFFSKQSYRIFLIHHVLLVIIVVPVAILYAWHPIFTFTTYFIFCIVLATILGYISQPLASLLKALLNH